MSEKLESSRCCGLLGRPLEELVAAGMELDRSRLATPIAVLPGESTLASLEAFQEAPIRQRARYSTERITDFINYVTAEQSEDTAVFIAPNGRRCQAVLDYGGSDNPGWGEHEAILELPQTPEYEALTECTNRSNSQRQLLDWLEDWSNVIEPQGADGQPVSMPLALQAIRKVDLTRKHSSTHEHQDLRASVSGLSEIDARGTASNLPTRFIVSTALYPETAIRPITARLSLLTGGDEPAFRLRIVGLDALHKDVAEEIENLLRSGLECRVYVGSVSIKKP